MHETGPKGDNLSVEVLSLLFRHKAHAEDVLTCGTHVHGELIVHGLHIESLSVEVCKCGGDFLKALYCFLHGGLCSPKTTGLGSVSPWIYRGCRRWVWVWGGSNPPPLPQTQPPANFFF